MKGHVTELYNDPSMKGCVTELYNDPSMKGHDADLECISYFFNVLVLT